uniref:Venom protein n=1 Tax=Strongyloides stercoralis TaxID=6248 RepID=A0A0K0EFE5_STRER
MRTILFAILCSFILLLSLRGIHGNDDDCPDGKTPESLKESCKCCKMNCWNAKADEAANELGHIPGEGSEDEALKTLTLIKKCVMDKCTKYCKAQFRPRPFFSGM